MKLVARRIAGWLAVATWSAVPACSVLLDGDLAVIQCADEGAFGPPACPDLQTCVDGSCREVGLPLGGSCSADSDCRAPATCIDLGEIVGGASDRRCSSPCCTSEDCGKQAGGIVCRPLALAASTLCVPATLAGAPAELGSLAGSAGCVANSDCRSGACSKGACVDVCCRSSECEREGDVCGFASGPAESENTWVCIAPSEEGTIEAGAPCFLDAECRSGACSVVVDGRRYCAGTCCSSFDCGAVQGGSLVGEGQLFACSKLNGSRTCSRVVPATATGKVGDACVEDNECRSGSCLDDPRGRYCSDLCCEDASCGDPERFACLPRSVGSSWALRCVRR